MSQAESEIMNLCHLRYGILAEYLPNCLSRRCGTSFATSSVACVTWSSDDTPLMAAAILMVSTCFMVVGYLSVNDSICRQVLFFFLYSITDDRLLVNNTIQ